MFPFQCIVYVLWHICTFEGYGEMTIWFLPSASIGIAGYCRHSMGLSARPSVRPKRRCRSNSLSISAIDLKFGGVMHSTMKQNTLQMAMLCYCAGVHRILKMWGNHTTDRNLVAWCSVPWSGSLFEMAMFSQCTHFLISADPEGAVILWTSCISNRYICIYDKLTTRMPQAHIISHTHIWQVLMVKLCQYVKWCFHWRYGYNQRRLDIFNSLCPSYTIWSHRFGSISFQAMAYHLFGTRPLLCREPVLIYSQLGPCEQISGKSQSKYNIFNSTQYISNVVFKMLAILFSPQCVKMPAKLGRSSSVSSFVLSAYCVGLIICGYIVAILGVALSLTLCWSHASE